MSKKEKANLKRRMEEVYSEKKRLEQDNKRPKQDNEFRLDEFVFNPGLQHVALQIFKQLDPKSLGSCRSVSKSWKEVIDDDKTWWQSLLLEYKSFMIKKVYKRYSNDQLEEFIEVMEYINDNECFKNLKLFATFMRVYCRDVKKNLERNDFDSPLHFAADQNRIDIFQIIVRSPMKKMNIENWNQYTRFGSRPYSYIEGTLLSEAIVKNQIDVIEFYMDLEFRGEKKIDFCEKDSLFHKACQLNNDRVVKLFLKRAQDLNIDLNARDSEGLTPMMYGRTKMVMQLLLNDHRIDAGATDDTTRRTALHHVCRSYYVGPIVLDEHIIKFEEQILDTISLMLKSSKIHLTKDAYGNTPLHYTLFFEGYERRAELILKMALERCIDVNPVNNRGQTPAHRAFANPCMAKIDVVLKYAKQVGINLEATDSNGRTPLHILCRELKNNSSQIKNILKLAKEKYGIEFDLNAMDKDGKTPMEYVNHMINQMT